MCTYELEWQSKNVFRKRKIGRLPINAGQTFKSKEAALLAFWEAGKMSAKKLEDMGGSMRTEVSPVILAKSMKSNIINPQIAGVFGELAQSSKSTELKLKLKSNLRREIYSALEKAGVKSDTCGYLDKVLAGIAI